MANKYTQKQMFEAVIALAKGEHTDVPMSEVVGFAEKKIEQLAAKVSKVDTKKAEEHTALMDAIKVALYNGGKPMTATEIMKAVNVANGTDYTLPKITAILRKMLPTDEKNPKGTGEVVRIMDKKSALFSLAD